jgi:hypothetical protein
MALVRRYRPNEARQPIDVDPASFSCTETFRAVITAERTRGSALLTSNRIWRGGSFKSAPVPTTYFYQNINNPEYYFPFADVGLRTVRPR